MSEPLAGQAACFRRSKCLADHQYLRELDHDAQLSVSWLRAVRQVTPHDEPSRGPSSRRRGRFSRSGCGARGRGPSRPSPRSPVSAGHAKSAAVAAHRVLDHSGVGGRHALELELEAAGERPRRSAGGRVVGETGRVERFLASTKPAARGASPHRRASSSEATRGSQVLQRAQRWRHGGSRSRSTGTGTGAASRGTRSRRRDRGGVPNTRTTSTWRPSSARLQSAAEVRWLNAARGPTASKPARSRREERGQRGPPHRRRGRGWSRPADAAAIAAGVSGSASNSDRVTNPSWGRRERRDPGVDVGRRGATPGSSTSWVSGGVGVGCLAGGGACHRSCTRCAARAADGTEFDAVTPRSLTVQGLHERLAGAVDAAHDRAALAAERVGGLRVGEAGDVRDDGDVAVDLGQGADAARTVGLLGARGEKKRPSRQRRCELGSARGAGPAGSRSPSWHNAAKIGIEGWPRRASGGGQTPGVQKSPCVMRERGLAAAGTDPPCSAVGPLGTTLARRDLTPGATPSPVRRAIGGGTGVGTRSGVVCTLYGSAYRRRQSGRTERA